MEVVKNILEIFYFLSGPAIAVIAYLALGQIRVAKDQMEEQKKALRITSKRDALKVTAEQVTLYCDKIIPLHNILDKKIKSEGIDALDKFKVEFDSGSIKIAPPKEEVSFKDFDCFIEELVDVANAMESFSTYFASGVADEKIAYLSLGSTFCSSMEKISPVLIPLSNDGRRFSACLRLFSIWGERLESESLERQKTEIESKLKTKRKVSTKVIGSDA